MRMHNAASYGAADLPVEELEMLQAGPIAYQHDSATTAVCGDALLAPEGHKFVPASDALRHRVTDLEQAGRYLDTVEPDQRLLAVALEHQPNRNRSGPATHPHFPGDRRWPGRLHLDLTATPRAARHTAAPPAGAAISNAVQATNAGPAPRSRYEAAHADLGLPPDMP
jgi:hypothetical protein